MPWKQCSLCGEGIGADLRPLPIQALHSGYHPYSSFRPIEGKCPSQIRSNICLASHVPALGLELLLPVLTRLLVCYSCPLLAVSTPKSFSSNETAEGQGSKPELVMKQIWSSRCNPPSYCYPQIVWVILLRPLFLDMRDSSFIHPHCIWRCG